LLDIDLNPDVPARLDQLDGQLATQHRRLVSELHSLTADSDLSDMLDDDVANGEGIEREATWLLVRHVRDQRREIAAARQRLVNGSYGRCTACNLPISLERLETLPAASTCVACAH
jgi:RNA polymerase-binding transcription factor DksA